ncbi:uncharacterized protein LOC110024550 [Phalaenopsis equestris]|uniref:uncharacterized protein LOC110024550 n=1 Tax=Phalaenopsis equestris TaxID=78828 RepID=UPI0009E56A75|nr:uncharacterized protein LOC110024550 [Phalaenopsis equestris]XP_020580237.1 uncharacterized protein LOC110024550 [Phalaenopsis equestris]XP_020580238.1 uncharacterized protein LOC110024550 [Phalaenopsis equestris]XP_020580239.1 uncharacterized protein LOC110024550 [Phalaenopsis equestris]XP_020580240.1 uncharacterized protein LOC110024550 [Phalaenopsis equestris]XP_020580241.1 uncharacterized protein LOC110024550 [Phalaenopsis equestris]XP_020580242.1 uncharacterized protein LOC110024550 [
MEKDSIENGIKPKEGLEKKSRGPMFLSNAYHKVQSRYLKAPRSSCHDFCKYGHKHVVNDEVKHTVFRRFMANNIAADALQNHVSDLSIGERRKSSGLKMKASDKANSIESPTKTIPQDSVQMRSLNSNKKKKKKKKKKKQTVQPNASLVMEPSPSRQNKLKASTAISSGSGPSYMKETITSSALRVKSEKKMAVRNLSGSSELQSEKKNVSVSSKKIDSCAKPAISLKGRVPLVRSAAQLNATRNLEGSRDLDIKLSKSFKIHRVGDRKFKNIENATNIRYKKHDGGVDFNVNLQKIIEEKCENEIMDVNGEIFIKEGDGCASEPCVSELSEFEDANRKQSCELSEQQDKRRLRRTPYVQPDNGSSLPYKMKFKRGRVIDIRPTENVGPRRLRFRRGRVLDENSNGEVMKRILRRRDKGEMKAPGSVVTHANSSEAGAVMLKHQDAQEKKDIQALFNHVIEETASKLVETRKSKVKALVGAFETVISLQENRAAQIV